MCGDRALEQHLDRQPLAAQPLARREAGEAGEPGRRVPGQRLEPRRALGDRAPQRGPRALALAAGRVGQQRERIGADAAERRRQHRVERALLVRVGEQRQVGDAVADLLLRPVAAAADHVGAAGPPPPAPARRAAASSSRGRARRRRAAGGRRRPPRAAGRRPRGPPRGARAARRASPSPRSAARWSQPAVSTASSSTAGGPGGSGSNSRSTSGARPGTSGVKPLPSSGPIAALTTARISCLDLKLTVRLRTRDASSAARRARKMRTSAWRKP